MKSKVRIGSVEAFIATLKHYNLFQDEELYKVVCPFHGDVNPSMQINVPKCFWYCYGCGKGGNTVDLVKAFHPEYSYFRVVDEISSYMDDGRGIIGGEELPSLSNLSISSVKQKLNYTEGLKLAKNFYSTLPPTNWYRFSYDPDEWENFQRIKRYLLKRGFTPSTLQKAGAKYTYKANYPVVFPLLENGLFRGYVMRTDDPTVEAARKYMYNRGFKRERTLTGNFRSDTVILVEGFMDKLRTNQLGFENVCAILGWKITSTQLEKLKKAKVAKVICALDNDESGIKGYKYLKLLGKKHNFSVERLRYPKGCKDMGDVLPKTDAASKVVTQLKKFGAT